MANSVSLKNDRQKLVTEGYLIPFMLVTSLFFLWGFAHGCLDVLNKHFQELLSISKAKSALVQFVFYGGYFLMAIPAGLLMQRFGYKKGIIWGLLLFCAGAFLMFPATFIQTFGSFLACLFIIACGLTFLETAANPYTTVLGPPESAERRINFSQSFNGLGWIAGPLIGGLLIFSNTESENKFSSIALPYMVIGTLVLLVALLFWRVTLPEVKEESQKADDNGPDSNAADYDVSWRNLFRHRHFVLAVIAQFFYVAAQTGVNSFFINYVTEEMPAISNQAASRILAFGGMGLFWLGRFTGSTIFMRLAKPNRLLAIYALMNVITMIIVMAGLGWFSVVALFSTYFFMSIMFPTIFALGIKDLGPLTKKASSFLVMAIVGGALIPMLMGHIADISTMATGFAVPLACFAFILYFGLDGYKVRIAGK
ncbi:MAG TPA: L-fucose:H+ symporter permease [Bacteroidales bacterium]|jgi:FHS family L-fucose permease-like MFS transporter|nr:L-fucose:H+ symporter permease [Bacteroidales bacterium]HOS70832.1 L-fucose:H+ symporter permease [Bacteroidales bacterium]HQH24449.1 L-fucose:H+ symporter permease [Bacteroidales bacterium]HQJ81418.1 L-fucose:H+ symporter permease [Bacteroidales bacterium]